MIRRRAAIIGSLAALFAPAVIRTPGLPMPVKAFQFDGPVTATEILQRQQMALSSFVVKNNALWLVQWGKTSVIEMNWRTGETVISRLAA